VKHLQDLKQVVKRSWHGVFLEGDATGPLHFRLAQNLSIDINTSINPELFVREIARFTGTLLCRAEMWMQYEDGYYHGCPGFATHLTSEVMRFTLVLAVPVW